LLVFFETRCSYLSVSIHTAVLVITSCHCCTTGTVVVELMHVVANS